jgi:hypothetical protein
MNHRSSKVVTLSKGTSASALTRNVCPQTTKKTIFLDTSDVVRDVEKLTSQKSTEIRTRQDALQTTFSVRLDIFYPLNFP